MARLRSTVTALAVMCAGSAYAQTPATASHAYTVAGVVTDASGAPLNSVEVWLLVSGTPTRLVRTRDDGRFSISGDMGAKSKLQMRRLGYLRREVDLYFPRDSSRLLTIVLEATPVRLSEVEVQEQATESTEWLRDFDDRRRKNSFGHYYTRETIKAGNVRNASEALRMVPGVLLASARRGGYVLRMRGCKLPPMVWLDGMRIPRTELDEVVSVEDIAAIEVYVSTAGVPAQFMDRSNSGCGTIVVWTRHQ